MDILDKDISVSFPTNADDPVYLGRKYISQSSIPQMSKYNIIFY